jgi:enamine deaminase RidA (YjgF/YER057c/UK114 family)
MNIARMDVHPTYSDVVIHGNTVYLAGQVPWKTAAAGAPLREQAWEVLDLISQKLSRAGSSLSKMLSMQVFLRDPNGYDEFNSVFTQFVPAGTAPARNTICGVSFPNPNWKLEVVVIAAL